MKYVPEFESESFDDIRDLGKFEIFLKAVPDLIFIWLHNLLLLKAIKGHVLHGLLFIWYNEYTIFDFVS